MKRITKRMLAVLLALVMVIGFVPGNLSVLASAEGNTIYVAPNGNDETGDGQTLETAFESIQRAVNSITDDSVETTIIVADGAYNVFVDSDSALLVAGSVGHGLYINKDNVTIQAADGATPILYSSMDKSTVTANYMVPTVRINSGNVTLDGLTILPALNAQTTGPFSIAVSENALRNHVGAESAAEDTTFYMYNDSSSYNTGVITISNMGEDVTESVTIQNCRIGYSDGTTDIKKVLTLNFAANMKGDYHIKGNDIYGRALLQNGVPSTGINEIVNNDLYYGGFYINIAAGDEAGLPRIRENRLHSVYLNNATNGVYLITYHTSEVKAYYTPGEASVIAQSNTAFDTYQYGYHLALSAANILGSKASTVPGIAFAKTTNEYYDTKMDTEEELCYYLGHEGDVTLTQNFTITKDIMPAKIVANLDMGTYTITTNDNTFAAPAGYFWNASSQLEKENWIATALLLQNDLNMKFYVADELVANGEYLVVTMGDETVNLRNWQDGTGANAGRKYVIFSGIMATEMMETVSVQLYDANGEAVDGKDHTDSVRLYANRLKEIYSGNTAAMDLITAVLNYGAAAQTFAGESDATKLANYGWQ